MTPRNLQTLWAGLLIDGLAEAGITHVVISPGSRSTPLVLAAARNAALRLHDCVDERAAAFFALGIARATGRPAMLLCTSGTAPAHYLPAVVEASTARVPLLVVSADRPAELADCAAPQTIDQVRLFGRYARFFDLGSPDPTARFLHATRRTAAQAVLATRWPEAGAVQLNVRLRKPLEPVEGASDDERALARVAAEVRRARFPRVHTPARVLDRAVVAEVARGLAVARGLVVCGPGPLEQAEAREAVAGLCRATGWPLLAEATSQLRFGPPDGVLVVGAFDHVLASPSFRAEVAPEAIVQIGLPPVASSWAPYLDAHPGCRRVVLAAAGWNDPASTAAELLLADLAPTVRQLAQALPPGIADPTWAARWAQADHEAATAARDGAQGEADVVRRAIRALPEGAVLAVGNSLPVRLIDQFVGAAEAPPVPVLSQRGASGIDGLIAGAAGAAVATERPVLLILGDVSAVHDLNGLLLAPTHVPLCVLVLHNGGGRIFELLPVARDPGVRADELAHLTTPHDRGFEAAASFYGVRYARPAVEEVTATVGEALARPGCTVVEAVVEPHGAARALAAIRARLGG